MKKMSGAVLIPLIAGSILLSSCEMEQGLVGPTGQAEIHEDSPAYLMAYFRSGPNQTDMSRKLHYAFSRDGTKWYELHDNEAVWSTPVGGQIIRDPFINKGPDGYYHLVHTMHSSPGSAYAGRQIGYAKSKDLIHFTDMKAITVMGNFPDTVNSWAPEWNWDSENSRYVIHWSSTRNSTKADDNRIYKTYTKDWETFEPAELMFDPGYSVIDSNITYFDGNYYMFFKDEENRPMRNRFAVSSTLDSGYADVSIHLTPNTTEAAEVLKLTGQNKWYLYYDYWAGGKYGVKESTDMLNWSNEIHESHVRFPYQSRHAAFFPIDEKELHTLIDHFSLVAQYRVNNDKGALERVKQTSQTDSGSYTLRTLSFWIKTDDVNGNQVIYDEGDADNGIALKMEDGFLYAAAAFNGSNTEIKTKFTDTGSWNHVVIGFNGLSPRIAGELRLYVNGALVGIEQTKFNRIRAGAEGWHIGERSGSDAFGEQGGRNRFKGQIYEAAIYNTLLQDEDVLYLYHHPAKSSF